MKRFLSCLFMAALLCATLPIAVFAADEKNIVFCTGVNKVCVNDREVIRISDSADTRPFVSGVDVYLPLAFVLEQFGGSYGADGDLLTLTMPNGQVWYASAYRNAIWQRTSKVEHFDIISKNGVIFIALDALKKYAGLSYREEEGMVVLANGKNVPTLTDAWIVKLQEKLYYERPTAKQLLEDFQKQNEKEAHPRLLVRSDDFARIRNLVETDELMASWYSSVKRVADAALDTNPPRWELRDGMRLLYVSQEVQARIWNLSICWQVEKDEKYAERVWRELDAVTDYADWHAVHFLDTAAMLNATAIGYDWCYDYFTSEQRSKIAKGIYELGLTPAWQQYQNTYVSTDTGSYWASFTKERINGWSLGNSNWNSWGNNGIILGCLAIADECEAEFCMNFISEALKRLEYVLPAYAPDGASEEGIGYGLISSGYLTEIFAAMETALGTDYDYFFVPGIAELADFPVYMNGPAGKFNYHDAGDESKQYMPEAFYYAERLNKPTLALQRIEGLKNHVITYNFKDILWYNPEKYADASETEGMSLDKYFRKVETGSFRGSWDDPYAFYLTFHGGENNVSHMHFDAGTFVMDAMGERWACDLGSDPVSYTTTTAYNRYDVYRIKAEGHNTLYINPSKASDQEWVAWNPVETFVSRAAGGYAIMNLTNAYKSQVNSARRGFALTDNRSKVMIQDEIEFKNRSEIYWGMHTRAEIELSEDKKTAILSQNGKRLRASLISEDGEFEVLRAEPLPASGSVEGQADDSKDVAKLAVHIKNKSKTTICVEFTCVMEESDLKREVGTVVPMDEWTISGSNEELPTLKNIYVDGKPLDSFKPAIKNYNLYLPLTTNKVPEITADGGEYIVDVTPPPTYENSVCRIEVSDGQDARSVYYLQIMIQPMVGIPENLVKLPIDGVKASGYQNDSGGYHAPQHAIDGNLDTKWTVQGDGSWLEVDLGESKTVNFAAISFGSGDSRRYDFEIQISEDGNEWKTIYSGSGTGATVDMETHKLKESRGRYVRYVAHGYNGNPAAWNNVNEIELYANK